MSQIPFPNPFRPGAGHSPPYLAGRAKEQAEFKGLLDQQPILDNLVLTGLRGVGKTVLLETFRPIALEHGWLWAGADMSEAATLSEENIALRLITDLAPLVTGTRIGESERRGIGFLAQVEKTPIELNFQVLHQIFQGTPGLVSDKLKVVLELVWNCLKETKCKGVVLAYDEAQNLGDQASAGQYPLSLLLDVFQSIQKRGYPYLLVLTGLPTLFPKLVDARTFAERMFHVVTLSRLSEAECRDAILKPMEDSKCPVKFTGTGVDQIIKYSGGYPYFIQFLCREFFDVYLQQRTAGKQQPDVRVQHMVNKLDTDFFAGRWNRVTDRQRELLSVVAELPNCDEEFTPTEIVEKSKNSLNKSFGASQVNQLLSKLAEAGLVYKNRHGRYSFAVPLLGQFIRRQNSDMASLL